MILGYVVTALATLNVLQRNNDGSYSVGVGAPGSYRYGGKAFTYLCLFCTVVNLTVYVKRRIKLFCVSLSVFFIYCKQVKLIPFFLVVFNASCKNGST